MVTISNNCLLSKLRKSSGTYLTDNLNEILNVTTIYDIYHNYTLPCYAGDYESKFFNIKIVIDSKLGNKHDVYNRISDWQEYIQIYTDGAKTQDRVSMAIYDLSIGNGYGLRLPDITSIYTAEACAILAALDYIENRIQSIRELKKWIIIADCMSVLLALANPMYSSGTPFIIHDIRKKYYKLTVQDKIDIVIFWTPSHVGVIGNERVDYLARLITNTSVVIPYRNIKIPISDCFVLVKKKIQDLWKRHWEGSLQRKGQWYRAINSNIISPWFCKGKQYVNRRFYTTICRLRIGHGRFNEHLHRMNILPSPYCTYCNCGLIQSLDHIFFECNNFAVQRLLLIEDLFRIYGNAESIPRSLQIILKNRQCYTTLCNYICSTIGEI